MVFLLSRFVNDHDDEGPGYFWLYCRLFAGVNGIVVDRYVIVGENVAEPAYKFSITTDSTASAGEKPKTRE